MIKTVKFIASWLDEAAHEAWEIATIHSTLELWRNNDWVEYLRSESENYEAEFQEDYPLIEAGITLEEVGYASTNKAV